MKYIIGSIILSSGIILIALIVLMSLPTQPPVSVMKYFGWAWLVLAIVLYPVARKLIRD